MKKSEPTRTKRKPVQKRGRIRSQKRNGYDVPASFYWFPITPKKIRRAVQKIAEDLHPEKIILFGSFAYGKPTPDSDVDLLVVMESRENVHARVRQVSHILRPRPFPVDIIVRTPAELKERLKIGDSFFQEITAKGIVLYEQPSH